MRRTSGRVHAQAAPRAAAPGCRGADEYRLGAGDVVRITVYQNPDLTLETRVTEAGVVSYPLLGSVRLGGLTVTAGREADRRRPAQRQLRQAAAGDASW